MGRRDDRAGIDLLAAGKRHADGVLAARADARDLSAGPKFRAEGTGCRRQRGRHAAHAAPGETPRPRLAVDVADVMGLMHEVERLREVRLRLDERRGDLDRALDMLRSPDATRVVVVRN